MRKKLVLALGIVALLLAATACANVTTANNEIALHYSGAVYRGHKKFLGVIPGGDVRKKIGLNDSAYCYPSDKRSFIIDRDPAVGDTRHSDFTTVVSKDQIQMGVETQVYFTLNQDVNVIRAFHEQIGLKTHAYSGCNGSNDFGKKSNWAKMLEEYFRPQLDRALTAAASDYNWQDLYSNNATKVSFQEKAGKYFQQYLVDSLGGDYFCGPAYNGHNDCGDPSFTVKKPLPQDSSIVKALEDQVANQLQAKAQVQKNAQLKDQATGIANLIRELGPDNYVLLQAIQACQTQDKCPVQLIIVPKSGSGSYNVTVPSAK